MIDPVVSQQADHVEPTAVSTRPSPLARLSLAHVLYGLLLLAGAYLRFSGLGLLPLSPDEAREALAAWQVSQPGAALAAVGSPAYFSLTSLLMLFLGVSDVTARLVPALFGLALVALPWLLRRELAAGGALVAGLLLAVSPLFSAVSRTAGGDAIALFALLLLLVALWRWAARPEGRWLAVTAVALALGLTSSPLFYSGLVATLPALWLARRVTGSAPLARPAGPDARRALLLGAVSFLLLSTRLLTYPAGLGASAALLGDWLAQFRLSGELLDLLAPVLAIGRYETAVFLVGIPVILWAVWRNEPFGTFLTYWVLAAFALILLQRGMLNNALLVVLPVYLLIGLFAGTLLRRPLTRWTWGVTSSLLLAAGIVLVNLTRYLRVAQFGDDLSNLWFAFLALAGAALALYYFWSLTSASLAQGALVAGLVLLALYQWGTAWHLTHVAANDPRERWVNAATDDDLPVLLETLSEISNRASNADADLALFSTIDTPVLRWYLRDYWNAQFGATLPPQAAFAAVITPAAAATPALGTDYLGSDFGLLRSGATAAPTSATPLQDGLRSWLFHETSQSLLEDRLILWVRADIIQGPQ